MTPKEVRNEIVKRFLAQFTGQFAIAVTGHRFVPPQIPAPWVRISVIFNEGGQTSLGVKGNRRFQKSGFVNVQVFTPVNKGTDQNDDMAQNILAFLDGESMGHGLWLYDGSIKTIGDKDDYYQQNVVIEFNFEDIR